MASISPLASRFGASFAGVAVLIPAVTLIGFFYLGRDKGDTAVLTASASAFWALPTVAAFLLAVNWSLRSGWSVNVALGVGLLAWLIVAVPVSMLRG